MRLITFLTGERETRAGVLLENTIIALDYPTVAKTRNYPNITHSEARTFSVGM